MKRYMKNEKTGVIFSYDPVALKANRNLFECNENGIPIGRPDSLLPDDLYSKIEELNKVIEDKDLHIAMLESRVEELENKLVNSDPVNVRRRELQELTLEELKQKAAELEITVRGNKSDFIEAILESE